MDPQIIAVATAKPDHDSTTEEIFPYLEHWLKERDPEALPVLDRVSRAIQIDRRGSALSLEETFQSRSFEEQNGRYIECVLPLASRAFEDALNASKVEAADIDCLITVSCTGFMIPSLDAYLANRFGLKSTLQRLPVFQMGCAGGTAGLIYASDYLRAHPGDTVAVIAAELPSLTLQQRDTSFANIVSTSLFADGAACVILGSIADLRPAICDQQMVHFRETTDVMGYRLTDTGLQIVLDKSIPDVIDENLESLILPFLARNRLAVSDVSHMIFHPGSMKILSRAEELLDPHGKDVRESRAVLRRHGNMSSVTVLFILAEILARDVAAGSHALMVAFGPGFTGHTLLLQWR